MNKDAQRLAKEGFRIGEEPAGMFLGGQFGRALESLKQSLSPADSPALVLLTAPDGCGKSTLLGRLVYDLDDARVASRVRGRLETPEEFLLAVLVGFGFEESPGNQSQLRHILQAFLLHQGVHKPRAIVIIEDTPSLKPQVLAELRWIAQLASDGQALADIVMSGLPGLERIVTAPAMGVLATRRQQLIELEPMDIDETRSYIHHRLSLAGDPGLEGLFAEEAVSLIHDLTGGIPGLVDTLGETAVACAGEADELRVGAASVEAAAGRLHRVSVAGVTRVQGARSSDTKAVPDADFGQLVVMRDETLVLDYRIRKERVLIGRRPENDVCLAYPPVSAYHAMLVRDVDGWVLIDLQSTNGTYIASRRVRQQRLRGGETISIANFQIRCSGLSRPAGRGKRTAGGHPPPAGPTPPTQNPDDVHAATLTRADEAAAVASGPTLAPDKERGNGG